jgi:hypothetical protein
MPSALKVNDAERLLLQRDFEVSPMEQQQAIAAA